MKFLKFLATLLIYDNDSYYEKIASKIIFAMTYLTKIKFTQKIQNNIKTSKFGNPDFWILLRHFYISTIIIAFSMNIFIIFSV